MTAFQHLECRTQLSDRQQLEARSNFWTERRRFRGLDVLTFGLRILVLVASLTVTAPYLAQVIFHNDIERFIDTESTQAIGAKREQIVNKYETAIDQKSKEIEEKRFRYEQEVAGKGPSGRYGVGPAATAIFGDVKKLEEERGLLFQGKENVLESFDGLASNWRSNRDKLAASYNVALTRVSILESRKALEALSHRPEYRMTELAIKAFLALIFAGLLLLKLFEPSSVRLYLSDVLQQEFSRYLAGTFDPMLPATERSTNARFVMSPQRLYDFLARVWVPARLLEARQADAHARSSAAAQHLQLLEQMKDRIDRELALVAAEVQRTCSSLDEANRGLTQLHSAIATATADRSYFQIELAALEEPKSTLDKKNQLEYEMKSFEYRSFLQHEIAGADRALHELNEAVPTETEKFNRATGALKRVEVKLQGKEAELTVAESRVRFVREKIQNSAGDRAETILGAAAS